MILEELRNKASNRRVMLSRSLRILLYLIFLSLQAWTNVSSSIMSIAAKIIKRDLGVNDASYGLFSPFNCAGRVVSSSLFVFLNERMSRKFIILFTMGLKSFFIFAFTLTKNNITLLILRFFIGFMHMPITVYLPVWIDQFGIKGKKTFLMGAIPLVQAGGKSLGVFLYNCFHEEKWESGFKVESLWIIFATICMFFFSEDYFSRTLYSKESEEQQKIQRISCSIFEDDEEIKKNIKDENEGKKSSSFFNDLRQLSTNSLFMIGMFCRVGIYGINTGLHFWANDFMRTVLGVKDGKAIFWSYTIICIGGPLGGFFSNLIFKPCIGTYESKNSSWSLVFIQAISAGFAVGLSLTNSLIKFTIFTFLYLVFNSVVIPILQGMLITSVDKRIAATGFSIVNILTQLLVSGFAPVLYGFINDRYKKRYPHLAMFCQMSIHVIAVPFLAIMAFLRNKKFEEKEKEKEKMFDIELEETPRD